MIGAVQRDTALPGFGRERGARPYEGTDIGDRVVDAMATRAALGVEGLVEVLAPLGVDRDELQIEAFKSAEVVVGDARPDDLGRRSLDLDRESLRHIEALADAPEPGLDQGGVGETDAGQRHGTDRTGWAPRPDRRARALAFARHGEADDRDQRTRPDRDRVADPVGRGRLARVDRRHRSGRGP